MSGRPVTSSVVRVKSTKILRVVKKWETPHTTFIHFVHHSHHCSWSLNFKCHKQEKKASVRTGARYSNS
jgi:hypothetical protein